MLCAGTWDLSGFSQVFSRDDSSGRWSAMTLPGNRITSNIQQVRALGFHADRQTGTEHVFVGNNPYGIYRGMYDPTTPGRIRWGDKPELDLSTIAAPPSPGLTLPRVAGFTECNGIFYATVGQQIYRRVDGAEPRWRLLYTNPKPGHSETGLRGLTAIPNPAGPGQVLLTTVEGSVARALRIDPQSGEETSELDFQAYLNRAWNTRVSYIIAAYNDMMTLPDAHGGVEVLFGIETFLPAKLPLPAGHARVDGLDGGGWYLVRHADGKYDLHRIATEHPVTHSALIATRAIALSPFADDPDRIYFAGYDANKLPAHNTAWIFRASRAEVLAGPAVPPPADKP
jgi:poly(A) polymerase